MSADLTSLIAEHETFPESAVHCTCGDFTPISRGGWAAHLAAVIESHFNDCDTEALRRNRKHRELLAEAWDEGWAAGFRDEDPHNPYRGDDHE